MYGKLVSDRQNRPNKDALKIPYSQKKQSLNSAPNGYQSQKSIK